MDQNSFVIRNVESVAPHRSRPSQHALDPLAEQSQIMNPTAAHPRKKSRLAFIWGVSGTGLSALGFIVLTLYQQYNDSLNELRRDLNHFHEISGELVKKEGLRKCRDKLIDCLKEVRESTALREQIERDLRASEEQRKEMTHELQHVRERLASIEGRQSALAIVVPQLQHDAGGSKGQGPHRERHSSDAAPTSVAGAASAAK
jgi:hypothetical protein